MIVVGLDLSTRSCGVARHDGRLVTIKPRAGAEDPARRLDEIETGVGHHIHPRCELAVIEGYGAGSVRGMTIAKLGEVAGVVKLRLFRMGVPFTLVPPSSLKKFATGKGNASKDLMVAACVAAGGCPSNDDEADAFWLRRYGLENG